MQEILNFIDGDEIKENSMPDEGLEEWKQKKREARERMKAMQNLPYEIKKKRSELRANEFMEQMNVRGKNAHVSVGGLDSITLHVFLKSIGINVPAIFEELYYKQPYSRNGSGNIIAYEPVESIIPEIYGEIEKDANGNLETTEAKRTGCSMCGFGIHMEERPHRFDKLRERNPKEWEFYMYKCCTDPDTGEKYGWGRVLDYIGVEWEDIPSVQMTLFDFPEVMP